jgi:hypothetical protein
VPVPRLGGRLHSRDLAWPKYEAASMSLPEWLHWVALAVIGAILYFLFDWQILTLWEGAAVFGVLTAGAALLEWFRRQSKTEDRPQGDGQTQNVSTQGNDSPTVAGSAGKLQGDHGFQIGAVAGNVYLGATAPEPSTNVTAATVRDAQQNHEELKATTAPPDISVEATGGKDVRVTLHNGGGPFKLRTRIKLRKASRQIDDTSVHEYFERKVHGGSGISQYVIASCFDNGSRMWIQGEFQDLLQKWEIHWSATDVPLKFEVLMVFLAAKDNEQLEKIGQWKVEAEYIAKKERFESVKATRLVEPRPEQDE